MEHKVSLEADRSSAIQETPPPPAFYKTQRFITALKTARQLSLS